MSEPLAAVDTWRPVMEAAGFRCQCEGECGNAHAKGSGRCQHEHDHHTSKHGRRIRLMAAPADPLTTAVAAAGLPADRLRAWCPDCHSGAARRARRQLPATPTDQCSLFDL
ncbi:hypothetical protein ACFVGN_14325 [Streptomyces sp. NPDC057757]|uniref:hypothetical protein n=1 Tax=Streptomyces sp. NPDC057757 TaxID=3346241 RepID=UPI0036C82829